MIVSGSQNYGLFRVIVGHRLSNRVCQTLLRKSKGKCLNDRDEDSNTALHLAAVARHADVVRLLIGQGADKEAK